MMKIYTSNRLEKLARSLASKISQKESVFQKDTVVIQSQGMAKWLQLQLAQINGISAQTDFPFLKSFIVETLLSTGHFERNELWDRPTLVWRTFKLLPKLESKHPVLSQYIRNEEERRYQLATQIAALFDEYMVYRQDWLETWNWNKELPFPEAKEHQAWQKDIWRQLVAIETPSFEKALYRFIKDDKLSPKQFQKLRAISIFGITNMPPLFIAFFQKLSTLIEVKMFYLSPCQEYWADIKMGKNDKLERAEEEQLPDLAHSLLKSWGLLGRDFLNLLIENTDFHDEDLYQENEGEFTTLKAIQNGILYLADEFHEALPEDGSIQINACHTPIRELEVLHEHILALKDADPNLNARDIIVLSPDIQAYAPYIETVFNGENPIPFSISDRSFSANSLLINSFKKILNLTKGRLSNNDVLSILESDFVLNKFGLNDQDLPQIRDWVDQAAIRWGENDKHREELKLAHYLQNTWEFGFDRLLAGYAFEEEELFENSLSLNIHGEAELLGRFRQFTHELFAVNSKLKQQQSTESWQSLFTFILENFFADNDESNLDLNLINSAISQLAQEWLNAEITTELCPEIAINALIAKLDEESSSRSFMSRGVTFCTLLPMRSIPAKAICILGMNEGVFPRHDRRSGFDLLSYSWRQGDRTARLDDRYIFLESFLSARQHFYCSYIGFDQSDNSEIPPSIILSELIDYLAEVYQKDFSATAHPLQSFSAKYFSSDKAVYSQQSYDSALALFQQSESRKKFCPKQLSLPEKLLQENGDISIELEQICEFFKHPSKAFLKTQLNSSLWQEEQEELAENEAFDRPNGLEEWSLKQNILADIQTHSTLTEEELYQRYRAKAILPYGQAGKEVFTQLYKDATEFQDCLKELEQGQEEDKVLIDLHLAFNSTTVHITGEVDRIFGDKHLPAYMSSDKFKDRITSSLKELCLQKTYPETYQTIHTSLFKKSAKSFPTRSILAEDSEDLLKFFVTLYLSGLAQPLPFFPDAFDDFHYPFIKNVEASPEDYERAFEKVAAHWQPSPNNYSAESQDESYVKCFGPEFPAQAADDKALMIKIYEQVSQNYQKIWEDK